MSSINSEQVSVLKKSGVTEDIYKTRFDALIGEIDKFIEKHLGPEADRVRKRDGAEQACDSEPLVPRVLTIEYLAYCLKEFAKKQYEFFKAGFDIGNPSLTLKPCQEEPCYTREHVFGRLMRQISADLTILKRAYYTRKLGSCSEKEALEMADQLAQKALKLAIEGGVISNETTVLTYFQKTAFVRVIPYAPVAIIGIPVTCVDQTNNFRDFMAIPHEVGHYVYWHAREGLQEDLDNCTATESNPACKGWIEPGRGNDTRLSLKIFETINSFIQNCLMPILVMFWRKMECSSW